MLLQQQMATHKHIRDGRALGNTEPLQQPPDSKAKETRVLAQNQQLGNRRADFVFTDISSGFDDHTRRILVREKDGTLRTANEEERSRQNQHFFAKLNVPLRAPGLLQPEMVLI